MFVVLVSICCRLWVVFLNLLMMCVFSVCLSVWFIGWLIRLIFSVLVCWCWRVWLKMIVIRCCWICWLYSWLFFFSVINCVSLLFSKLFVGWRVSIYWKLKFFLLNGWVNIVWSWFLMWWIFCLMILVVIVCIRFVMCLIVLFLFWLISWKMIWKW